MLGGLKRVPTYSSNVYNLTNMYSIVSLPSLTECRAALHSKLSLYSCTCYNHKPQCAQ